mgnify:CR=1 FL=1
MSTLLPLVSSAAYGVSDYLGGVAARRTSALDVVAVAYPTSVVGMAILSLVLPGEVTAGALLWGAGSGAVMAFAIWWFYLALAAGPISVVSPLTAVLVAAVPVPVALLQGEAPSALAWWGIGIGVAAVLLVSWTPSGAAGRIRPATLLLTVGAGAAFAASFVLTAQIPSGAGVAPLLAARCAATLIILAVVLVTRRDRDPDTATPRSLTDSLGVPIAIGLVDVVANLAMYYTFQLGDLAVGSVVIALYPAFTVALAVLVLRERLRMWQAGGLLAAAFSVLLVHSGS